MLAVKASHRYQSVIELKNDMNAYGLFGGNNAPQIPPQNFQQMPQQNFQQIPPAPAKNKFVLPAIVAAACMVFLIPLTIYFAINNSNNSPTNHQTRDSGERSSIPVIAPNHAPSATDSPQDFSARPPENSSENIFENSPAPTQPPAQIAVNWRTWEHDFFTISIPDSLITTRWERGYDITNGDDIYMSMGSFHRYDDYFEWLYYGIHENQFGIPIRRSEFIFDDGRQGFLVEDSFEIVFLCDTYCFRLLFFDDRSLFTNNEEMIVRIARSITPKFAITIPADTSQGLAGDFGWNYGSWSTGDWAHLYFIPDGQGHFYAENQNDPFVWWIQGSQVYLDYGNLTESFYFEVIGDFLHLWWDNGYLIFEREWYGC
jgi:hypothetical protein